MKKKETPKKTTPVTPVTPTPTPAENKSTPKTPEELLNELRKKMQIPTPQEVKAATERGSHFMQEWCAQNESDFRKLPIEIKDVKSTMAVAIGLSATGQLPIITLIHAMGQALEAAFNLGKAQPK